MEADDVPLAIQRYATAKLRTVADLTRLTTLGYRGEALAAAAICADLELVTSTGGVGTYLQFPPSL
jgi:DNA mismatch repair protein MutL